MQTTSASKAKNSVLVLDTRYKYNRPLLLNAAGSSNYDIFFRFNGHIVHNACSVIVDNEMFVYQGKWISKVSTCELQKVGELPFTFHHGGCTISQNQVFVCFSNQSGEGDLCHEAGSPLGEFKQIKRSVYEHTFTRIASSETEVLAVASNNHLHAELYRFSDQSWHVIQDYPYSGSNYLRYFPVLFHNDGFLVFGSNYASSINKFIGRLDAVTNIWSNVGSLVTPRYGHNAIFTGSEILIVGGWSGKIKTEKCVESNGRWICNEQNPALESYYVYPELMMVPDDFCKTIC